jgi:tetratricopeptide (TPR) repeat protein
MRTPDPSAKEAVMSKPNLCISTAVVVAVLAVLSALAAPRASAQDGPVKLAAVGTVESAVAKAEAFRAEAEGLKGRLSNFPKMKRLYEQAARVAPQTDLERVTDLLQAGRIAFYLRDLPEAQRLLIRAAETARDMGDVFRAGQSYVEAAIVTARLGEAEYARELLHRAHLLAESPLLLPPYCDCLRNRVARLEGRTEFVFLEG